MRYWLMGGLMAGVSHLMMSEQCSLFCKRKQQKWTQSYRDRIGQIERAKLMPPSGLAAVEDAKANGSWLANLDVDDLVSPSDLIEVLKLYEGESWWEGAAPSL